LKIVNNRYCEKDDAVDFEIEQHDHDGYPSPKAQDKVKYLGTTMYYFKIKFSSVIGIYVFSGSVQ
jgi:hypothetical protein